MAQEPTTGKRKLHSYSLEFKIKAVNFVKAGNSKEETARMYGVDSKRIREWCNQQDKLKDAWGSQNAKRCKLDGVGRSPLLETVEESLYSWIEDLRARD